VARKISKIKIKKIKELHSNGLKNREISRRLNINHRTVSKYLKEFGLISNGYIRQKIELIDKKNAKCSKCKEIKPIKEFQFNRRGQKYEYRFSFCNACRKKQAYLNLNSDIKKRLNDFCNRKKREAIKNNIQFDLDGKYLLLMFKKQKGKCFYTEYEIDWKVGKGFKRNALSLDRIDNDKGYVKGNIVLCTKKANTIKSDMTLNEMKKWMPDWYNRILCFKKRGFLS